MTFPCFFNWALKFGKFTSNAKSTKEVKIGQNIKEYHFLQTFKQEFQSEKWHY